MVIAGRYELVRRIADGGMASVWEGRDTVLDRTVAVKVVDLGSADPTLGERLQREAVATAALNHPDIVTVHDAGVEDRTAYVVMALVAGQDLGRVVAERGPLPVAEAARIGSRVAGALAAAHAAGIVHRDVKPGNVIVDGDRVTVVDFGIASVEGAQAGLTVAGTVIGTAHSMAPEQAAGRPTSPATDVYALGCLLTTLLTGAPPFEAETPLAVLRRHVADPPPSLRARRPEVPPALDALVLAMLAKDPAARPGGDAVQAALASAAASPDGAPTTDRPGTAATQVIPPLAATAVLPAAAASGAGTGPAARAAAYPPHRPAPPPRTTGPRRPPARRRGRGWVPIAVLAVVAVVALAALATMLDGDGPPEVAAAGDATPTAEAPTTPAQQVEPDPVAEPEPEPEPEEPAPTDVAGVLAALDLDDEVRRDLENRWSAVTRELAKDNEEKAAERLRDLLGRIDELEQEGRLTPEAAEALRTAALVTSGIAPAEGDARNGRGRGGD